MQLFKNYKRFEVQSWKVWFDCKSPIPGSVGSRLNFLEVQRFEVRNFPVRPKTKCNDNVNEDSDTDDNWWKQFDPGSSLHRVPLNKTFDKYSKKYNKI